VIEAGQYGIVMYRGRRVLYDDDDTETKAIIYPNIHDYDYTIEEWFNGVYRIVPRRLLHPIAEEIADAATTSR
jgi:hypothetical protein